MMLKMFCFHILTWSNIRINVFFFFLFLKEKHEGELFICVIDLLNRNVVNREIYLDDRVLRGRANMIRIPEQTPQYFNKILPYAILNLQCRECSHITSIFTYHLSIFMGQIGQGLSFGVNPSGVIAIAEPNEEVDENNVDQLMIMLTKRLNPLLRSQMIQKIFFSQFTIYVS